MTGLINSPLKRRAIVLGGGAGIVALTVPGCASLPGFDLTEAVRRLLLLSSENAFARLVQPGGFWDEQVGKLGLDRLIGANNNVLTRVLTSTVVKRRVDAAFADVAIEGSRRAAPIVTEAVRLIGIDNAVALVRGGPRVATEALRGELGGRLIEEMVPELGRVIRLAKDPLVAQTLGVATGADISDTVQRLAGNIDEAIWDQIGFEEAEIRANPQSTNDPVLIGVFGRT